MSDATDRDVAPTRAEILRRHTRGGFVFTRLVSQRLGAVATRAGVTRGWRPAALTMAALAVSLTTSLAVALLAPHRLAAAAVAVVGWQLAYALDCADGQLARTTGRTSDAGAALDLYGDWAGRLAEVAALLVVLGERGVTLPVPLTVLLTGALLAALYHEAVNRVGAVEDVPRRAVHEVLGAVRDPGVTLLLFGIAAGLPAPWLVAVLAMTGLLGAGQFVVRFGRLTRRAWAV